MKTIGVLHITRNITRNREQYEYLSVFDWWRYYPLERDRLRGWYGGTIYPVDWEKGDLLTSENQPLL
jgi:hypothetical protein